MGPILPVGVDSPRQLYGPTPQSSHPTRLSGLSSSPGNASLTPTANNAQTRAIMNLSSAVSQLLQAVGGGVENDKALRMLIALMILLALLNEMQAPDTTASRGLGRSAAGGRPLALFGSSSSSFIAIQQTSTTIAIGTAESLSSVYTDPPPASGANFDARA